jgi:predicted AlkP superfamily phosphohydrolase/phosphomutase
MRTWRAAAPREVKLDMEWQPAYRYRHYWPRMEAFALPSYYDGQIRLNLRGRERNGRVDPARYDETVQAVETLLGECRNSLTGEPAVAFVERASTRDPLALDPSEADLRVVWRGLITGLEHPRLGLVGPVALRRTGGHTGSHGVAYISAPGIAPGDHGVRSSFDVAPTVVDLLGGPPVLGMTGRSLLRV